MADFVKLNGYDVKDAVSRNLLANISDTLNGIKRPEDFGCVGDGIIDDTLNFQAALEGGGYLLGTPGKTYRITSELHIPANTVIDLNYAELSADNLSHIFYNFTDEDTDVLVYNGNGNITIKNGTIIGGAISFIHSHDVLIENIHFRNTNNDHVLEICACNNYTVKDCIFDGISNLYPSVREMINIDPCVYNSFPWLPSGSNTYDGTKNNEIIIINNVFKPSDNTNYAYMQRAMGCHNYTSAKHSNIVFSGNIISGNTDADFAVNLYDMTNVMISNNQMTSKYGVNLNGCDYVSILSNKSYCNDSSPRVFCTPSSDNVSTHISFQGNVLINRRGKILGSYDTGKLSLDMMQPSNEWNGNANTINTEIPLTDVNTMILQIGAVDSAQLSTHIVKAFPSRGFLVNESFPLFMKYGLAIVTVTSEKQITISTSVSGGYTNCRHLILEKDTELM